MEIDWILIHSTKPFDQFDQFDQFSNNEMTYLISFEMLANQNDPKTVKNSDKV